MCDGRRKNFQRLPTLLILMVGLSFAFLACGCVSVRYALAEEGSGGGSFDYGVVYGPNSAAGLSDSDDPRYLVQVYAPNNYYAALIALGYNPTSSSFTADARAYLSNQSTGGAFYDFAQLFSNNNTDWGDEITSTPTLTPGINFDVANMETALKINNSNYGADNVWSAEYTTTQRIAAVTAVGLVLSGTLGGGGGGGNVPEDYPPHSYQFNFEDLKGPNAIIQPDNVGISGISPKVTVGASNWTRLHQKAEDYPYVTVLLKTSYSGGKYYSWNNWTAYLYMSAQPLTITTDADGYGVRVTGIVGCGLEQAGTYNTKGNWSGNLNNLPSFTTERNIDSTFRYVYVYQTDPTGGQPTVPPTNWPDPPESPTVDPPSVPDPPSDDPIQQPTDTPIQPPNVWTPIVSPSDPTFTVDLQGILDALATHCQHIRNNLDSNFAQLYNNMTDYWSRKYTNFKQFLDGQFGYIGDTIVDETDDLMDYLKELFEWLAEQFDWSVSGTGYNDNTVVSWLRKIYNRLGGGTTIRPPDPVVQPKETGDWLSQLLQNLVNELLSLGQDVLADLVASFSQLISKFPFSIPWDIAAILALLVAEPQAPVLELPQYAYTGVAIQQVGTYRLDLSEWDSVMEVVRPMETILFAGWLAFKTDFFKGLLELSKG